MKWLQSSLLLAMAGIGVHGWREAKGKEIRYTTVEGYFLQDDPATDASSFDYVSGKNHRRINSNITDSTRSRHHRTWG